MKSPREVMNLFIGSSCQLLYECKKSRAKRAAGESVHVDARKAEVGFAVERLDDYADANLETLDPGGRKQSSP